jgi:hypothetical protein
MKQNVKYRMKYEVPSTRVLPQATTELRKAATRTNHYEYICFKTYLYSAKVDSTAPIYNNNVVVTPQRSDGELSWAKSYTLPDLARKTFHGAATVTTSRLRRTH